MSGLLYPILLAGHAEDKGRKDTMEDRFVCFESFSEVCPDAPAKSAFFGVYDGHGGPDTSLLLAENLHMEFAKCIHNNNCSVTDAFGMAFVEMDRLIIEKSNEEGWTSGSTAVTAYILSDDLHVANVGDSDAILAQKSLDGRLVPISMTTIHKASDPAEKARIEKLGGHVFFDRVFGALAVSRSFGDIKFKRPKSTVDFVSIDPSIRVRKLDSSCKFLILASDGLWDAMKCQEVLDFVQGKFDLGMNPSQVAQSLVDQSIKKTFDNITVLIVQFLWDAATKTPPNFSIDTNIANYACVQ